MHVEITGRNVELTEPIRRHVERRLTAALDQHADKVRRVDVALEDVNGPRGGRDSVCKIAITLARGQMVRICRHGEDLYANISLSADKVKRAVRRTVKRRIDARRRPARSPMAFG